MEVADAQRVKVLVPLIAKTDRIDARVLADLSYRDLVPAIWLSPPAVRGMRELGRFRLHLVRHRSALKNRIHSTLITRGRPVPVSDLFGVTGWRLLDDLELPEAWFRSTLATLEVIDHLDTQIGRCAAQQPSIERRSCSRPLRVLDRCWALPSLLRSVTSPDSLLLRSWLVTPGCVPASTNQETPIAEVH